MILYACVSDVRTKEVLAEHEHEDENENGQNLGSLAVRCIESAPKFHLSYSHTACNRIYAFLMDHQQQHGEEQSLSLELIFFAIADVSLGSANTFFFLRCLRQAFTARPYSSSSTSQLRQRFDDDLFLPVLYLLALDASLPPAAPSCQQRREEQDKKTLPLTTFPTTDEGCDDDDDDDEQQQQHSGSSRKRSKGSKGKSRRKNDDRKEGTEEEEEEEEEEKKKNVNIVNVSSSHSRGMEEIISVVDHHHHRVHHPEDLHIVHVRGKKSLLSSHRLWTQYVRLVLLIDLVACTLLFGIWLSVCGGFHCITN